MHILRGQILFAKALITADKIIFFLKRMKRCLRIDIALFDSGKGKRLREWELNLEACNKMAAREWGITTKRAEARVV